MYNPAGPREVKVLHFLFEALNPYRSPCYLDRYKNPQNSTRAFRRYQKIHNLYELSKSDCTSLGFALALIPSSGSRLISQQTCFNEIILLFYQGKEGRELTCCSLCQALCVLALYISSSLHDKRSIHPFVAYKQTCNLKLFNISIQTKKQQFLKYACMLLLLSHFSRV